VFLMSACQSNAMVNFPRDDNNYLESGRVQINGVNSWLPAISSVYKGGLDIAYGTIEMERATELEIYLPCGTKGFDWRIEKANELKVEETTIDMQTEEERAGEEKSWLLKKYLVNIPQNISEVVFKRYDNREEITKENYQLNIVFKDKEELVFPRENRNYPARDAMKINGKTYTIPDIVRAYYEERTVYGTLEIERATGLEIYLPQAAGICEWKVIKQDGIKVEESWMNLQTDEDELLDGQSWALQKFKVQIKENVSEIEFSWDNIYQDDEKYHLTIKLK